MKTLATAMAFHYSKGCMISPVIVLSMMNFGVWKTDLPEPAYKLVSTQLVREVTWHQGTTYMLVRT
jgi:hypothetical protein